MRTQNFASNIAQINLNREELCQNCEVGICIQNCRNCLFNVLCVYEGPTNDAIL